MLGYEAISDLVVSWALRRGESVGVKRNDGIDEAVAAAMDRLGRVVWERLQQDSAWEGLNSQRSDVPLTKHRVERAIEAAADRDRAFWYRLQGAAGDVQRQAREHPASAKAAGIVVEPEPGTRVQDQRRGLSAGIFLAVGAVAIVTLVVFVAALHQDGPAKAEQVAGGNTGANSAHQNSGHEDSQEGAAGAPRKVVDQNGTEYEVRSGGVTSDGHGYLELSLEVTNTLGLPVTLTPTLITLAVPRTLVSGTCHRGPGDSCLVPVTGEKTLTPLAPGESRTLTYRTAKPLIRDAGTARIEVYQGDEALPGG